MKLIDKDALVAEIEKIIDILIKNSGCIGAFGENQITVYEDVLSLINTIDVKEVDIENAAITEWNDYIKKIDGEPDYAYMLIKREDYIALAKHFFELGLQAQKGEEYDRQRD